MCNNVTCLIAEFVRKRTHSNIMSWLTLSGDN
jgi:hypothetical protein